MGRFFRKVQTFIYAGLTAISFLMMPVFLGYIIFYSVLQFDLFKVVAGCLSMCVMIHLNKSL